MMMNTSIECSIDLIGSVKTTVTTTDQSGAKATYNTGFAGALTALAIAYPSEVKKLITPVTTTTTSQDGQTTTTTSPSIAITLGLG